MSLFYLITQHFSKWTCLEPPPPHPPLTATQCAHCKNCSFVYYFFMIWFMFICIHRVNFTKCILYICKQRNYVCDENSHVLFGSCTDPPTHKGHYNWTQSISFSKPQLYSGIIRARKISCLNTSVPEMCNLVMVPIYKSINLCGIKLMFCTINTKTFQSVLIASLQAWENFTVFITVQITIAFFLLKINILVKHLKIYI